MPCCMKLFALVTMLTFILPRTTQSSSNYTWSTADGCASRSARTTVTCANCSVHSSIDKDSLMTTFLTGICSSSVRIMGKWLSYIWASHFWRVFSALFIRHSDHSMTLIMEAGVSEYTVPRKKKTEPYRYSGSGVCPARTWPNLTTWQFKCSLFAAISVLNQLFIHLGVFCAPFYIHSLFMGQTIKQ